MHEPNAYQTKDIKPKFFTSLKFKDLAQNSPLQALNSQQPPKKSVKKEKTMRYAAYVRVSSEEQIGNYSIDAQKRAITTWVQAQQGVLSKVYCDEGESGRKADRPGFQALRRDARHRPFDAIVVHKFDRFARNRTDALAIKSLLRYDYGIKVFSVTEPSEDSDGPIGALIEGIMESVAEWYSRNLGAEVKKGVKERHAQGIHNRKPPFGYKRGKSKVIDIIESDAKGVILAFDAYATGLHSYTSIARLLNEHGYKSTSGRVFSRDTVREILRNRIYLGEVCYQETRYNQDGTRNFTAPVEWVKGQHQPIVDQETWDKCENTRQKRKIHRQGAKRYRPYLLRGLVYCYNCCCNPGVGVDFPSWGRMYCRTHNEHNISYYYCSSRQRRLQPCKQRSVVVEEIDAQVVSALTNLKPSKTWRKDVITAISDALGEQDLEQRLAEIRATIERMDFRWDNGFITDRNDYLEKRLRLQQELEQLTPAYDELDRAVALLDNLPHHLAQCGDDIEKQYDLIKLILERVYVDGNKVVAMTLKSDYHFALGHNAKGPTYLEVDPVAHAWAQRDLNP